MIGWKTRDTVQAYIDQLTEFTVFEQIIKACLNGELKSFLTVLGLEHISYYLVWQPDYKFLDIQSRYGSYYYEWRFYPEDFQYRIYEDSCGISRPVTLQYEAFPELSCIFTRMKQLLPGK